MSTKTQVNTDAVQTLSNKTLTAPIINAGVCGADPTTPLGIATQQYVDAAVIFPTGIQLPYAGPTAPAGWLLCDGSAVSRTTYAALFAIAGTTYGAGDGSTTFNVPNKPGRVSVGAGSGAGLTTRTRGQRGGEEAHALTAAENGPHTHSYTQPATDNAGPSNAGSAEMDTTAAGTTGSSGSGTPHNTMMPYEVDTWIIKT